MFKLWFRNFIDVRDSDGAERCLRTAIELGIPEQTIADMIFAAITDHMYMLTAGHTLDFANKAFELPWTIWAGSMRDRCSRALCAGWRACETQ